LLPGVDASELLMFENTVFTALATPGVRFGENAGIFLSAWFFAAHASGG
jgi:hypothetical protein